jgi:hypothetical protein
MLFVLSEVKLLFTEEVDITLGSLQTEVALGLATRAIF